MKKSIVSILVASAATLSSKAEMVVTFADKPNTTTTSMKESQAFDFKRLSEEKSSSVSWGSVGTIEQTYSKNGDSRGEDSKSSEKTDGGERGSDPTTTLSLKKASSYFGMRVSGEGKDDILEFYNGKELVGQVAISKMLELASKNEKGERDSEGGDEKTASNFISFYGDAKTSWDKIVLRSESGSGFQADNIESRVEGWNPEKDGEMRGKVVASVSGEEMVAANEKSLTGPHWAASSGGTSTPAPTPSIEQTTSTTPAPAPSTTDTSSPSSSPSSTGGSTSGGGSGSTADALSAPPAAPAPPIAMLGIFGVAAAIRRRFSKPVSMI